MANLNIGIVIGKESWSLLQQEPFYSARFIHREETDEIVLVVRVEVLDFFLDVHPPLSLNLTVWSSPKGTWVIALAYLLHRTFGDTKGGIFYLNPRQASDSAILHKLLQQETLHVIFFSADMSEHLTVGVMQPTQTLTRWQQLVENMNRTLTGEKFDGESDPDFETALQDFQVRFSAQDLLAGVYQG